jgi:hypothetical protein
LALVDGPTIDSVLWQATSAGIFGMPVYIEGNKLVTMRFISPTNAPIVCYDLTDGTLLWEKEITGSTAKSLPVGVRDNQVYAIRSTDNLVDSLYAFDLTCIIHKPKIRQKIDPFGLVVEKIVFGEGDLTVDYRA